jgi:ribosomal protein S18 acetylase RimI-like enzyme
MPVSIHPLADTDLDSAAVILASAFQRTGNWANELYFYKSIQPDGYFGAYQDDTLAGMVGTTIYSTLGYVGMMGVHQDFQRRGIGLALMQHLLNWLDEKNIPQVQLDASEVGQPMYEKLGFVAQERVFVLQRQAGSPLPELPKQVERIQPSDLAALAEMDAKIFGADRRRVFSALLETYPGRAFKSHDAQGRITGYLFTQERRIGPWVMLEPGNDETLLQAALSLSFSGSISAIVPETSPMALKLLQRYGFEKMRVNRHMVRGAVQSTGQRTKVFAQASLSIG